MLASIRDECAHPPWPPNAAAIPPPRPTTLTDLDFDALCLITRHLKPADWKAWRSVCRATRDSVRDAATRLRIDLTDAVPETPPPRAALACVRAVHAFAHKERHENGPTLAPVAQLCRLATWIRDRAPHARVTVYVRCERAALDVAVIETLVKSGLLAQAEELALRADGATRQIKQECIAAFTPSLRVRAEIKVAAWNAVLDVITSLPVTDLRVLATSHSGPANADRVWTALPRAARTLTALDVCPGVPLHTALGASDEVVWFELADLTLRGDDGAEFLAAWPAECAPRLARVACVGGVQAWAGRQGVVVESV